MVHPAVVHPSALIALRRVRTQTKGPLFADIDMCDPVETDVTDYKLQVGIKESLLAAPEALGTQNSY